MGLLSRSYRKWERNRIVQLRVATNAANPRNSEKKMTKHCRKFGLRVKMCVWLGVSRGLDLAFLNAD